MTHNPSHVVVNPVSIKKITLTLLSYCRSENWAGWDPYDALNSRIFQILPFLDYRIPRLVLIQAMKRSPVNLRPLLLVPKTQNPKGLALFLTSLIKLSNLGVAKEGEIPELIESIKALRSPGTPYWCWGYSFPWQTRTILVPQGAPNLVCTTFVANALLDAYEFGAGPECLEMARSAASYISNELYWTQGDSIASLCYPTPSSLSRVHNANLLGAAFLSRVYRYTGDRALLEPALKVCQYTAAKQAEDGSWYYGEHPTQRWIDNFHTGYNLCALSEISRYLKTDEFVPHIRLGFEFYRKHFFQEDGAPKYFHDRLYPIDIHSAAQSIITLCAFRDLDETSMTTAHAVFQWTVTNLWNKRGYFNYQATPHYKNKIAYMRWSQAWMLLALATLMKHT